MTSRKKGIPGGLLILPLLFLFLMMPGQVKAAQNSCEVTIPVQIEYPVIRSRMERPIRLRWKQ